MEPNRYSAPVSRPATLFLGLVVSLIAVALLAFGGLGIYRLLQGPVPTDVKVILGVVVILGVGLGSIGARLLTGRQRRGGGLFSPWALRIGGAFFVLTPLILVLVQHSILGVIEAIGMISAGVGCFVIANRREQRLGEPSVPNQRLERP
jgi:hypothetical protein